MSLIDLLERPEHARLFPVLSETSKEGRTTSVVLACLSHVDEFGKAMLSTLGMKPGKRAKLSAFTEPVFKDQQGDKNMRPDGLLLLDSGRTQWTALVEAKIGNSKLVPEQVESYRTLARQHGVDCVVTISNQFTSSPALHPLEEVRKSRSRIPAFHWSWMSLLAMVELLVAQSEVEDDDHVALLEELRRFLIHDSAGVKGFDRMPPEWSELNKLIAAGGAIPARSPEASAVLNAWHQETRDVALILSRLTETHVRERLPKRLKADVLERQKAELSALRESKQLIAEYDIPNAAAPLMVVADVPRRTIEVGMTLRAPLDKKSSRARLNWLLRQIKTEQEDELFIRFHWPGRSEDTLHGLGGLRADPSRCEDGKDGLQVHSFHVFLARRLGARFAQQVNFITEIETAIPEFYREVGQGLVPWKKPAPRIKDATTLEDAAQETQDNQPVTEA